MLSKLLAKLFGSGLLNEALQSLLRHGLTILGGLLLGLNIDPALVGNWIEASIQLGAAGIMILVAYLMSLMNKQKLL